VATGDVSTLNPNDLSHLVARCGAYACIHVWGDLDHAVLHSLDIATEPQDEPVAGHQGISMSSAGHEAVVRLQVGGLAATQHIDVEPESPLWFGTACSLTTSGRAVAVEPQEIRIVDVRLSDIAASSGMRLVGTDGPVRMLSLVRSAQERGTGSLTYVSSPAYLDEFLSSGHDYAIVEERILSSSLPIDRPVLVCPDHNAEEAFFAAHIDLARRSAYSNVDAFRGVDVSIHPSAVVSDNVWVGDGVVIGPNAVVLANSVIGNRTLIKPNATVGGDGFEVKYVDQRRILVPHVGGVFLGHDVLIGSSTAVDRAIFGTYTVVGNHSKVDNLVHVAHNVAISEGSVIVAGAEISGSVVIGDGVWYGPNACCNHEVTIGDYAFIGTGSVITRDVEPFSLVAGSPARHLRYVCRCRSAMDFERERKCSACGSEYGIGPDGEIQVLRWGPRFRDAF